MRVCWRDRGTQGSKDQDTARAAFLLADGKLFGVVFRSSNLWRPTGHATVAERSISGTSAWRLNEEREDKKEKDNLVKKKASLLIWPRLKRSGLSATELDRLYARMGIARAMGHGCIIDFSLACVNSRVCR